LLTGLLSAEGSRPASPLEFAEGPPDDAEVARETAEALWQGLLADPRG
jgi:hypothetical protein